MAGLQHALLGAVVLLGFLTSQGYSQTEVSSFRCYQCNSFYDPNCGDPFSPVTLGYVNCSVRLPPDHLPDLEPLLCRKVVQKVQGQTRIIRGCGYIENDPPRDESTCMRRVGTHDVQVHYCVCYGDLCNSARSVQQPLLAVLAVAAFKTIFL